jgi:hypothetical protein
MCGKAAADLPQHIPNLFLASIQQISMTHSCPIRAQQQPRNYVLPCSCWLTRAAARMRLIRQSHKGRNRVDNSDCFRHGEERKLIFENYANGVDIENLMVDFKHSRLEIEKEIAFVAKKIKEHRFRRALIPQRRPQRRCNAIRFSISGSTGWRCSARCKNLGRNIFRPNCCCP